MKREVRVVFGSRETKVFIEDETNEWKKITFRLEIKRIRCPQWSRVKIQKQKINRAPISSSKIKQFPSL